MARTKPPEPAEVELRGGPGDGQTVMWNGVDDHVVFTLQSTQGAELGEETTTREGIDPASEVTVAHAYHLLGDGTAVWIDPAVGRTVDPATGRASYKAPAARR